MKSIALLVLAVSLTTTRPARADADDRGLGAGIAAGIACGSILGGGSLVPIVGSSVALARHERSHGWGIASVVVGSLDALGGALWLGLTGRNDIEVAIGAPFLAVGAVDIGLGVGLLAAPAARSIDRAHLSIVPLAGLDSTGRRMGGVGLRFTL